jgi:hypothetical protein
MDQIYRGADLTIIVAAGDDNQYGIPGVEDRPRKRLDRVKIGEYMIAQFPPSAQKTIQDQKWMSRGWTLQEATLSSRCLVFTDNEMYFECSSAASRESVGGLELVQNDEDLEQYESSVLSSDAKMFPYPSVFSPTGTLTKDECLAKNFDEFVAQVSTYRRRELTYDSDTLNAFSGITQIFQDAPCPVGNLCGIPLVTGGPPNPYLACGISWEPNIPDNYHQKNRSTVKRRLQAQFPSWSWAHHALGTPMTWCLSPDMLIRSHPTRISVENSDGGIHNLIDCLPVEQACVLPVTNPIALYFDVFLMPTEWLHPCKRPGFHWHWVTHVPHGNNIVKIQPRLPLGYVGQSREIRRGDIEFAAEENLLEMTGAGKWSYLFVGEEEEKHDHEGARQRHAFALVVAWQPDGSAARIGGVTLWPKRNWHASESFTRLLSKHSISRTRIRLV